MHVTKEQGDRVEIVPATARKNMPPRGKGQHDLIARGCLPGSENEEDW